MYPGSFTQAAIPFTSGSPWCQPASTTKLVLNSVCSIPIKPSSQHHPISLSLSSSSCRWGESKPAGPSPRAADQLGDLLPSCSTAASLTGPAPSSSQMVLGGLSSCAMPGMLQAPPHQLLRVKGPVQCSVTHFENMQGKERAEHICIMCVNVEPVKAQHKSQDRLTDTGFSPYWASSRLPLHTYQTNLNEHSIKRKRKKVFELSSW